MRTRHITSLISSGLVLVEVAVAILANVASAGDGGFWVWVILAPLVLLTAGMAAAMASRGAGQTDGTNETLPLTGPRVAQLSYDGGSLEGSTVSAPADSAVDVTQIASHKGVIRDCRVDLS